MTLNHVHFGTMNIAVFEQFYSRYFGFKRKFEEGNTLFLEDSKGFLIAVDPVKELPVLPEWYHLGFCQKDEKKVFQLYEQMKQNKENIVRDMMSSEGRFASYFVKDPDGNKLEISWHAE